ncbi:MAG: hypothetical protein MZU97_25230 [Bacillus subtilis]|nr:hypothetical protein [Bacillus subtilis]
MNDIQARIIKLSAPLVRSFSWIRSSTTALIYSVIVSARLLSYPTRLRLARSRFSSLSCAFGYVFAKDVTMERQTVKIMQSQSVYLKNKRRDFVTYVPMMEKVGPYILLKRAALYFTETWLFMEAFNQNRSGQTPVRFASNSLRNPLYDRIRWNPRPTANC